MPPGFAESPAQPVLDLSATHAAGKAVLPPYVPYKPPLRVRAKVGPGGRVVIPAAFRAAAGMEEGAEVTLTLHGPEVRIITPDGAIRRAREIVRRHIPADRSLVDEFLAGRAAMWDGEA